MERRDIELSSGRVSYLTWGTPGPRPTVVLLHGAGFDSASLSWALLGPALAGAGYHVLAPDHPGYGHSAKAPWPATVANLVDYVGEFIEALGLTRYAVGGLSLGGSLALSHALTRPEGLTALMLLAPYGIMPRVYDGRFAGLKHRLAWAMIHTRVQDALIAPMVRSRRLMAASIASIVRNPEQRAPELMDEILAAASPAAWRPFAEFQRDDVRWNGLRTNYSDRLGEITVPTLLVGGTHDTGVPLARVREAAGRITGAQLLVVDGAGHWVQRDRPDLVNPAVIAFLDEVR